MDPLFSTILYYGFAALLVAFFVALLWLGWMALSNLIK